MSLLVAAASDDLQLVKSFLKREDYGNYINAQNKNGYELVYRDSYWMMSGLTIEMPSCRWWCPESESR